MRAVVASGDTDQVLIESLAVEFLGATHATILLNAGEPVHEVANRLGHADVHETLNTYARIIEARQNGLGDRFAAALGHSG